MSPQFRFEVKIQIKLSFRLSLTLLLPLIRCLTLSLLNLYLHYLFKFLSTLTCVYTGHVEQDSLIFEPP